MKKRTNDPQELSRHTRNLRRHPTKQHFHVVYADKLAIGNFDVSS